MTGTSVDLLRRLAERHVQRELATHGCVNPCAHLYHGAEADVVYANEDEPWSAFVTHMLAERTKYGAYAVTMYRQVEGGVTVDIIPSSGVRVELRLPLEVG